MTLLGLDRETVRNAGFGSTPGLMIRMKNFVAGKRAVRQLHQLDDRLLADIGLARGEIHNRVWGRRG
jgi:uncharacterized protein YjiS (DUF1127 family)